MKRILSLLLVISLIFMLVGCGSEISTNSPLINENNDSEQYNENDQYDDTHVHNYSKATCTQAARCSCGDTVGSALGHNYSGKECTRCGLSNPNYKENTPNNSNHTHYYSSRVTTEATCGKEGIRTYTCSCGSSYTEKISKTSYHDWEYATCTKPKTCKDCGKTEGAAKGHNYYSSGKCSCGAVNPVVAQTLAKCSLTIPSLPKSVSYYGYNDKLYTTVSVTNITYKFECNNDGQIELELYFSGKKTYDYRGAGQSDSCKIGWKLYGPSGAVVESDTFYSPSVAMGESFSNQKEYAFDTYDNLPAGNYRLEISNVN